MSSVPPLDGRAAARLPLRRALGLVIVTGGALAAGQFLWQSALALDAPVRQALVGGLIAAMATALGTLPVAFTLPGGAATAERWRDATLGFGAGVMLAASAFSLIVPALAAASSQYPGRLPAAALVAAGILLGGLLLLALDRSLPHEHFIKGAEGGSAGGLRLKRTWLFVFAVTLHNLPEGLAIGVSYGGTDPLRASSLATGIAIQDVPEGFVIAVALLGAGYRRAVAVAIGALSGLIEPVGAVLGAAIIAASATLLPWGLAFAAGAMLFVISHEIIPESHRQGHERWATCGLMLGFVVMMMLDTALN